MNCSGACTLLPPPPPPPPPAAAAARYCPAAPAGNVHMEASDGPAAEGAAETGSIQKAPPGAALFGATVHIAAAETTPPGGRTRPAAASPPPDAAVLDDLEAEDGEEGPASWGGVFWGSSLKRSSLKRFLK